MAVIIPLPVATDAAISTVLTELRARCHAERQRALRSECPYCIAPIGESCQSASGRRLRDSHVHRGGSAMGAAADLGRTMMPRPRSISRPGRPRPSGRARGGHELLEYHTPHQSVPHERSAS